MDSGAWLATVHGIAELDTTEHKHVRACTHKHTHTHCALEELFLHGRCPCVTYMNLVILVCGLCFLVVIFWYGYLLYRSSVCAGCYPFDSISNRGL